MFANSARQKIEEDLSVLDRQIRLQLGETIKDEVESPAEAYLATPMVWTETPLNKMLCECWYCIVLGIYYIVLYMYILCETVEKCWNSSVMKKLKVL